MDDLLQRLHAVMAENDVLKCRAVSHVLDESSPTIFCNANGTLLVTVTPSANGNKRCQATVWGAHGPMSDAKHDSAQALIDHQFGIIRRLASEKNLPRYCAPRMRLGRTVQHGTTSRDPMCGLLLLLNGEYIASTPRESKLRRTEAGALGWFAQRGLDGRGQPMVRVDLLAGLDH